MRADCHMHMVLDGVDWKSAMGRHQPTPDDAYIRQVLGIYRDLGYTYLRDGGDKHGASVRARELAGEYGITYRSPIAPISLAGHYGGFIGYQVANLWEYAGLVKQFRRDGADFIKIMISGLMDFDRFGVLTEDGLDPAVIGEMIHIAKGEGFSVMAHANGARVMEAAAQAGVDSIEHGAYADHDALRAMVENQVVWVPTLSTIGELRRLPPQQGHWNGQWTMDNGQLPTPGCCAATLSQERVFGGACSPNNRKVGAAGGSDATAACGGNRELSEWPRSVSEEGAPSPTRAPSIATGDSSAAMPAQNDRKVGAAEVILESALRNVKAFAAMGGLVAPGTDAGAYAVPHGCGTEEGYLQAAGVSKEQMDFGVKAIMERF